MHIHKKKITFLGFIFLLLNTPNIVSTMDIKKLCFQEGQLVKQSNLNDQYIKEVKYTDLNYTIDNQPDYATESDSNDNTLIHGMPAADYFSWFNKNIQPTISRKKRDRERFAYQSHLEHDIINFKKKMLKSLDLNEIPRERNPNQLAISLRIYKNEFDFIISLQKKYDCFSFEEMYSLYFTI